MTAKLVDLAGERFGRLIVIERVQNFKSRGAKWLCKCDCGRTTEVLSSSLRHLKRGTKSCGCLIGVNLVTMVYVKHGLRYTPEYKVWNNMHTRCRNPKFRYFKDYGGRGITVCERWKRLENFYADMGPRPTPTHSIDRIDVNGNYEPSNCRWATPTQQVLNRRKYTRSKREDTLSPKQ